MHHSVQMCENPVKTCHNTYVLCKIYTLINQSHSMIFLLQRLGMIFCFEHYAWKIKQNMPIKMKVNVSKNHKCMIVDGYRRSGAWQSNTLCLALNWWWLKRNKKRCPARHLGGGWVGAEVFSEWTRTSLGNSLPIPLLSHFTIGSTDVQTFPISTQRFPSSWSFFRLSHRLLENMFLFGSSFKIFIIIGVLKWIFSDA